MSYIASTEIIVTPVLGCEFSEVALEAVKIAIDRDSTVSIIFNGGKYTIKPLDILKGFVESKE